MRPEILIPQVILASHGNRLVAVVDPTVGAAPGPTGVWSGGAAELADALRPLLAAVDPAIFLLAVAGWRTAAFEVWGQGAGGRAADRVDLLASALCVPTGRDDVSETAWHVPILRGQTAPPPSLSGWQVRLELDRQPLVLPEMVVELAALAELTMDAEPGRATVTFAGTGAFSSDALHAAIMGGTGSFGERLSGLLGEAAGTLTTSLHDAVPDALPDGIGLLAGLAPTGWIPDPPDYQAMGGEIAEMRKAIADKARAALGDLSSRLVGASLGTRTAFFLEEARRGGWFVPEAPEAAEGVAESLAEALSILRDTVYDAYETIRQLLGETQLLQRGPVHDESLGLRDWFRLHNDGVVDLLQGGGVRVREDADGVLDRIADGREPTADDLRTLAASRRRYPRDSRRVAASQVLLATQEFGGYLVQGVPGRHRDAWDDVLEALSATPFMWGNWEVLGSIGVTDNAPGPHTFHVVPHPSVASLAVAYLEWSVVGPRHHRAHFIEVRRRALEAHLPGATVSPEEKLRASDGYRLLPTPSAVLQAIHLDRAVTPETGAGIIIGHPDTGARKGRVPRNGADTSHHAAIAASLEPDMDQDLSPVAQWISPWPWEGHGTATASAIVGTGSFPGKNPLTGSWTSVAAAGVAPDARLVPARVTNNVILFVTNGAVDRVAKAITDFVNETDVRVISISLGYTFDLAAELAARQLFSPIDPFSHWSRRIVIGTIGEVTAALLTLRNAIMLAESRGVIVCAAAGHAPILAATRFGVPAYPAAFPEVIGCAALRGDGSPWSQSFGGPGTTVSVPGSGAWGAGWIDSDDLRADGGAAHAANAPETEFYRQSEGTSYSAAITAGVAALWLERHDGELKRRGLHAPSTFRQVLASCGLDPVRDQNGTPLTGWGHGKLHVERVLAHPF